jgi:hypothetical protein
MNVLNASRKCYGPVHWRFSFTKQKKVTSVSTSLSQLQSLYLSENDIFFFVFFCPDLFVKEPGMNGNLLQVPFFSGAV